MRYLLRRVMGRERGGAISIVFIVVWLGLIYTYLEDIDEDDPIGR